MTPISTIVVCFALIASLLGPSPHPAFVGGARGAGTAASEAGFVVGPGYGTYAWPVHGPVLRGFDPPPDPYGAGHRGIDIGAAFGTPLVAAQAGTVAFAGWVGGSLFISIDHDDGVRTTYSWLSAIAVAAGDRVMQGTVIGQTGRGDPASIAANLHFGARIGDAYIDPMLLLEPGSVAGFIHLAPLEGGWPGSTGGAPLQ